MLYHFFELNVFTITKLLIYLKKTFSEWLIEFGVFDTRLIAWYTGDFNVHVGHVNNTQRQKNVNKEQTISAPVYFDFCDTVATTSLEFL